MKPEKPTRADSSHKGENGKVAVIAGSKDYSGAPALSAKAALRTGADLTKIYTSEKVSSTVASYSENFIVGSYSSDYFDDAAVEGAAELVKWSDATVLGPGMSKPHTEAIQKLVENADKSLIIDAEAIKPALKTDVSKAVFTPHKEELKHIEERYGSAASFAEETGNIVVVKSKTDKIYAGSDVVENSTGTSAMTVGGTGDVLTGIIASLISQGLSRKNAAVSGAYLNGKAGELAAGDLGNGMLATDMIEKIPDALDEL